MNCPALDSTFQPTRRRQSGQPRFGGNHGQTADGHEIPQDVPFLFCISSDLREDLPFGRAIEANLRERSVCSQETGTYLDKNQIKAQLLAGYIDARSGGKLAYALFVNDAGDIGSLDDVLDVIEDEGEISTLIEQLN